MTTSQTTEFEIPAHRIEAFEAIVAKVARKATKLGLSPITFEITGERPARTYRIEAHDDFGGSITYRYVPETDDQPTTGTYSYAEGSVTTTETSPTTLYTVAVTGDEPYIEGYRFVASIDHEDGEQNIVSTVPGAEAPAGLVAKWIDAKADCAHCGLNRRRLNTFLLFSDGAADGIGFVQVGSTCIADYFPGKAADSIAQLAQLWITLAAAAYGEGEDYEGGGYTGKGGWLRSQVLAYAATFVRLYGWTSKARADEVRPSTASRVSDALAYRPGTKDERPPTVTDADVELAEKTAEWISSLDPSLDQDYLWNLKSACNRQVTTPKHLGLVVSAVGTFEREQARRIEKAAENADLIPVPEGRYELTGTVLSTKVYDGYAYNSAPVVKVLLLVTTDAGSFKVFGTLPSAIFEANRGDVLTLTAKVVRSNDDKFFGTYSRPTKASVVSRKDAA